MTLVEWLISSGLETSVSSSTLTSAIIYDAYTSIIKNNKKTDYSDAG